MRAKARALLDKALVRSKAANDVLYECYCLVGLGRVELARGNGGPDGLGKMFLEQSLRRSRQLNAKLPAGQAFVYLAAEHHEQGDLERAKRLYARATQMCREIGDRRWGAIAAGFQSVLLVETSDGPSVCTAARRAIAGLRKDGDTRLAAAFNAPLAAGEARQGEIARARGLLSRAQGEADGESDVVLSACLELGRALIEQADGGRASTPHYREKLETSIRVRIRLAARDINAANQSHDLVQLARLLLRLVSLG